jgi:hypothetical protein
MNASLVPLDLPPVKMISMKAIKADHDLQSRVEIDRAHAKGMSDNILRKLATPPPIVVFFDGRWYWIGDGFHRHFAYTQLKAQEMPCEVREGTRRDAMIYSAGANQRGKTGLERTKEDIKKAIRLLMEDEDWRTKAVMVIAEHVGCGCSAVRTEVVKWATETKTPLSETVVASDGRTLHRNGYPRKSPRVFVSARGAHCIGLGGGSHYIPNGVTDKQEYAKRAMKELEARNESHVAFVDHIGPRLVTHRLHTKGLRHTKSVAIMASRCGQRMIVGVKEDSPSGVLKAVGTTYALSRDVGNALRPTLVVPAGYLVAKVVAAAVCDSLGIDVMDPDELVAALQAEAQTDPPAEPAAPN